MDLYANHLHNNLRGAILRIKLEITAKLNSEKKEKN